MFSSLFSGLNRSFGVLTKSPSRFILVIWFALLIALGVTVFVSSPVRAVLTCINDTAGANDEPGQKDLTQLCVDNAGLPTSILVTWNWDEISVSGNNTLDACSLYDTDADGNVNFSLCVTDPTDNPISLTLYTCGDNRSDRCSQPIGTVSPFSSSCTTSTQNTDPFSTGDEFPQDRVASCNVILADVGAGSATLLDVCSYPSQEPNSDPSDCVILQENATPTPTPTDTPTNTPVPPTSTPTDTPTNTPVPPTSTPTDTPTNTPVPPTNTPTKTPTPVPPTHTPTPTKTPTPKPKFEGCTPGYWKNHLKAWGPTGYSPNQTLESVFNVPNSLGLDEVTLKQALSFQGGSGVQGGARILLRAAVAALLNAAHPDVDYALTVDQVINRVNTALASNSRAKMIELAAKLDKYNNLGCPLN